MKLHELVSLRNELRKSIDLSVIQLELERNSNKLRSLIPYSDPEYGRTIEQIATKHQKVIEELQQDVAQVQDTINSIEEDIASISSKFFEENYELELKYGDPNVIRTARRMQIIDNADQLLRHRIQLYSDWKYPALEIGCREGEWTKHLVASDPLYIADEYNEFLIAASEQFPSAYQARLRKYMINQDLKIPGLPLNQFGFIFSYNFFNYLSFDSIKQYLLQAMDWLRPGGVMLFTYNNADMPAGASYAETYFMSYVPKSMLIPMCESLGFDIIYSQDFEPAMCWIEIRKPGTLRTVKAHQALGEIKYR